MQRRFIDETFDARQAFWWCAGALGVFLATRWLPSLLLFTDRPADYATLHLLLESFSVIVCTMIATLAWYGMSPAVLGAPSFLFVGFGLVAGFDMLHAVSFKYMPWFGKAGTVQQGIIFWLAARTTEVLALTLIALRVRLSLHRNVLLAGVVSLLVLFAWLGTSHAERFPNFYVSGAGLTQLKRNWEIALCVGNLALAVALCFQYRAAGDVGRLRLAVASFIIGMGALFFTRYAVVADSDNLFGHLYKIVGYAFIYRAIFYFSVQEPYRLVEKSAATITEQRNQLGEVVEKLKITLKESRELRQALDAHAIVAITDRAGVITEVNDKFCAISGYAREELIGQTHRIINSGHHPRSFFDDLWRTIASGRVWGGEVCNRSKSGSLYWVQTTIVPYMDDRGRPAQYIAIRADITERKLAEQRVQRMALFDPVTELPNRRLLSDRLQTVYAHCRRSGHHGALLLLDLDDFKTVNDTLGHPQGDELLRQVGSRLAAGTREADTVARMGGDEFAVVLQELSGDLTEAVLQAQDVAQNLLKALAVPYQLGDAVADSAASIGVVVFPDGEADVQELLKHADIALYHAKEQGKNRVSLFDVSLQDTVVERAHLAADLRLALEREELAVHYQPIVDRHAVVVGCEALLRWQHPARGMVSPGVFIPLAEQAGAIVSIGAWVFEQACRQLVEWSRDPARASLTISVNVSARQMRDRDFVDVIQSTITRTGADARLLRLEITESLLQEDINDTIHKMDVLRDFGVQFALDDFGTGYSSLSYLRRLPLHSVKIDRVFVDGVVTDPNDAAIAQTILALAKTLGLQVVAEGVEDRGQFDFLLQNGCDAYQGFLFSKPLPPDRLGTFPVALSDKISDVPSAAPPM